MNSYSNTELALFRKGLKFICGVDEAGRGPLAGPVVAAAVIFPPDITIEGIDDSKRLSPLNRQKLSAVIQQKALTYSLAFASPQEIDNLNILQATRLAMKRAVGKLNPPPDFCLIDGYPLYDWDFPHIGVIKGDQKCFTIAAASILAKTHRDNLLINLHQLYPQYGFDHHKGYPTKAHRHALALYGPCPVHRMTFQLLERR
jgi:ribonuclease HII